MEGLEGGLFCDQTISWSIGQYFSIMSSFSFLLAGRSVGWDGVPP